MIKHCIREPGKRRCKGFTLTEMAIVLGIVGIILGAIWTAGASVYRNQRVSKAQQQITMLAANIKAHYSTRNDFNNYGSGYDLQPELLSAGVIPSDLGNATSAVLTTGIGGTLKIYTYGPAGRVRYFNIHLTQIEKDSECIALLIRTAGDNPISGLAEVPSNPNHQVFNTGDGWRRAENATGDSDGVCVELRWSFSLH